MHHPLFILLILLGFSLLSHADLIIRDNPEFAGKSFPMVTGWGNFPTGELLIVSEYANQSFAGAVVLTFSNNPTPYYWKKLQDFGAIGVLVFDIPGLSPGFSWFANFQQHLRDPASEVPLPVASLLLDDFIKLYSGLYYANNCTIEGIAKNEWVPLFAESSVPITTSIIFGILFIGCTMFGCYLLFTLWRKNQIRFNIATSCIILEIIGNILRAILVIINPFTFNLSAFPMILVTLHAPFSVICGLLMAFFWKEAVEKSIKVHTFLPKKSLIAAIVIGSIVLIIEVVLDIIKAVLANAEKISEFWRAMYGVYGCIFTILACFYCVTCTNSLLKLQKIMHKRKQTKILIVKVFLSGVGMIISSIGYWMQQSYLYPSSFAAAVWLILLGAFMQSLPQLLLFGTVRSKTSKTSGGKSKSKTNSTTNKEESTSKDQHTSQ